MKLKKKLRAFFTLTRKANGGFTLVELVVVIAILGILAGVGTVGYSGYVKYSKKGLDKKMVKEICYAIDVASKSYAFDIEGVDQADESGAQLPVGFIVLSNTADAKTLEASNDCASKDIKIYGKESWGQYSRDTTVSICSKHSNLTSLPSGNDGYYISNFNSLADDDAKANKLSSYKVYLYSSCPGKTDGTYYGEFSANSGGILHDIMTATYGDGYAQTVRLNSDEWNASSLPSFWTNATATWDNVKSLADMMYSMVTFTLVGPTVANAMGMNSDYSSSADIVFSVADACVNTFGDSETFAARWVTYGKSSETATLYGGDNFGFAEPYHTREFYSAMRGAYNNCVSNYILQHHSEANKEAHAIALAKYGESAGDLAKSKVNWIPSGLVNLIARENFPRQLCPSAFTTDGGKAYMGAASGCAECYELYKQYVSTGADKADAIAVYDTFVTAANTDLSAEGKISENNSANFYNTYASYLAQFEGMYKEAARLSKDGSCIVISVYYQDKQLHYEVSPLDAGEKN